MNKYELAQEEEKKALAPKVVEHLEHLAGIAVEHTKFGKGVIKDAYSMTNGNSYAQVEFEDKAIREFRLPLEEPWFIL